MDRGVIATANELFVARHYPSVVALVTDALSGEPDCVPLLVLRAKAHHALRRDLDAQSDLRDIIRLDPQCSVAYRLLGELAARRDENESAAIFFREAVRLDPGDREAVEWLQIVETTLRPVPNIAPVVGRVTPATRTARSLSAPARRSDTLVRFARGTQPPIADEDVDERPTDRGVGPRRSQIELTTKALPRDSVPPSTWKAPPLHGRALPLPPPVPTTMTGLPVPPTPSKPAPRLPQKPLPRAQTPELPGFGDYLVTAGILTRERLRAAQAYQRSMKVQLSTAIVTLGLATPQRIEWAAVSHQSELAKR